MPSAFRPPIFVPLACGLSPCSKGEGLPRKSRTSERGRAALKAGIRPWVLGSPYARNCGIWVGMKSVYTMPAA